ncbi:MAG: HepT-like ribonuclease domain-containing protein [Rhizobiaceae bacterium]
MPKDGRSLQTYLEHFIDWSDRLLQIEAVIRSNNDNVSDIEELALARAFQVVGEICGQLISSYPEWSEPRRKQGLDDAYRLRNRISHGYDGVDTRLLLAIARDDLQLLRSKVEVWLAEIGR